MKGFDLQNYIFLNVICYTIEIKLLSPNYLINKPFPQTLNFSL